ncbi:alpha/beta hydrolase family protein [Micromonospora sp. NPDC049559]|uniref:alpha/beta hydrolase n=1 Tax=Micromonospora sp. NPDC049559 TaxID=3155923 RepID=UPI0034203A30
MKILTETWFSESIERQKSITVALPPTYSLLGRPCPVLYLLHSFGGNRTSWFRCPSLAARASDLGLILVLPESGRSWLINDARGRRYEDYLLQEVVPYVDRHFNTVADRAGRAIAGFSMGGATAFFQALRHGDVFCAAGSNGGAFEAPLREGDPYHRHRHDQRLMMPTVADHERVWGPVGSDVRRTYDPYRLLRELGPDDPVPVFYLDVGLQDFSRTIAMNRNMRDALSARKMPFVYRERPGRHDWEFVEAGIDELLGFVSENLATR